MRKKWIVYKHTNKLNGKVYIGITCRTPKQRWKCGKGYVHNEHFNNAILKNGWDNFEHEVLFTDLTLEEASEKEKELIKKYDSTNREKGYNIKEGGIEHRGSTQEARERKRQRWLGENNPNYKRVWTEEERKHLSDLNTGEKHPKWGTHHSLETRKKISEALKGERNYMYGKKMSQEMKEKISKGQKRKIILCVETGKIYEGLRLASLDTGIHSLAIQGACVGRRKTGGGYHWKYIGETC